MWLACQADTLSIDFCESWHAEGGLAYCQLPLCCRPGTPASLFLRPGFLLQEKVPGWLEFGLHVFNSIAALVDLMACLPQRTFSSISESLSTAITVNYILLLIACRHYMGSFPYPFM